MRRAPTPPVTHSSRESGLESLADSELEEAGVKGRAHGSATPDARVTTDGGCPLDHHPPRGRCVGRDQCRMPVFLEADVGDEYRSPDKLDDAGKQYMVQLLPAESDRVSAMITSYDVDPEGHQHPHRPHPHPARPLMQVAGIGWASGAARSPLCSAPRPARQPIFSRSLIWSSCCSRSESR